MSDLAAAALGYASRGWPVFPCEPRGKRPLGRLAPHGLHDATLDSERITAWWRACAEANIGVSCGAAGLFVLDVDGPEGSATIIALQKQHGALPTSTLWQRTGGGGWQALFRDPAGELGNSARKLGAGLDTRGAGGYIVAPPSVHPSGSAYAWWNEDAEPLPVPAWIRRLLTVEPRPVAATMPAPQISDRYVEAAIQSEAAAVASTPAGARNATLNAATFSLARLIGEHLSEQQLYAAMRNAAAACGLPAGEADRTIRSAINARARTPRSAIGGTL
jgi:hypothetical protein